MSSLEVECANRSSHSSGENVPLQRPPLLVPSWSYHFIMNFMKFMRFSCFRLIFHQDNNHWAIWNTRSQISAGSILLLLSKIAIFNILISWPKFKSQYYIEQSELSDHQKPCRPIENIFTICYFLLDKASKTETLDLCQKNSCLAMQQGSILFWILEFIVHFIMMWQVFSNVFILFRKLWIRWGRCLLQFLNLPTASNNHVGGAILSLYDDLQPSVFKVC